MPLIISIGGAVYNRANSWGGEVTTPPTCEAARGRARWVNTDDTQMRACSVVSKREGVATVVGDKQSSDRGKHDGARRDWSTGRRQSAEHSSTEHQIPARFFASRRLRPPRTVAGLLCATGKSRPAPADPISSSTCPRTSILPPHNHNYHLHHPPLLPPSL